MAEFVSVVLADTEDTWHDLFRYVLPESFTHGSSAQRVQWFKRGIKTGAPAQCNTFAAQP